MRVSLTTLGCKANQYDTQAIAELFGRAGYTAVPFPAPAEVYIVNTCTVTQEAVRKSRQLVRRARRANPQAVVVLTGCYAQVGGEEALAIPGVSLVVGPQDRARLVDLVAEFRQDARRRLCVRPLGAEPAFLDLPAVSFAGHTRAWLKVEDGCNQACAYCQVPLARGPVRSLPPERVREEAGRLVEAGYREVVLTGVHLGLYGFDLPGRPTLADLALMLQNLPGLERFRLGSVEPHDLSPALLQTLAASDKFQPHLHLPLQSGDDAVLARMNRPYRRDDYARLLEEARRSIPDLAVSTDLIVGFPGETEKEFLSSLAFAAESGFSRLHVFPFSARPGTAAARLPHHLSRTEREARSREAVALGKRLALAFNQTLLGRMLSVLVEDWRDGRGQGLAGQYVEVRFSSPADPGRRVLQIEAVEANPEFIRGQLHFHLRSPRILKDF